MKLIIGNTEFWVKGDEELLLNFDSIYEKWEYIENNLHREDGPAIIWKDGSKVWYLNGKIHRIDGSAEIYSGGTKYWCLNDIRVNGEIYQKIQNSSKEELLVYMINSEYKNYLPLIEHRLNILN